MRMRNALMLAALAVPSALATAADFAEVKKAGALRVLVMFDTRRAEFFSEKAGSPGFDREVLDGFAGLHHLKLDVVKVASWDSLVPALLDGKGDLVAGRFTATEARRKLVLFTHEVFPTRNVVITRRPHAPVTSLEALRKETVGTIRGTSMAEAIAAAGVPPASVDDGLPAGGFGEALKSGRVTAAVWGVESAIALQREDPEIELGAFVGAPASLAYAARPGDKALVGALNDYIDSLRRTQTWGRLVVKYFGASAPEILKKARNE